MSSKYKIWVHIEKGEEDAPGELPMMACECKTLGEAQSMSVALCNAVPAIRTRNGLREFIRTHPLVTKEVEAYDNCQWADCFLRDIGLAAKAYQRVKFASRTPPVHTKERIRNFTDWEKVPPKIVRT